MTQTQNLIVCLLALSSFKLTSAIADDWPGWFGPEQSREWREEGIVDRFPEGGPPIKWRAPIQWGYSGPADANGKVYVMDYVHESGVVTNNGGGRDKSHGMERTLCFNAENGELIWRAEYPVHYDLSYPRRPRCTPTVAGGKVFSRGAIGNPSCLDAESGEVIWRKDFVKDYGAEVSHWGFSAHPLVDGDLVYCLGGDGGQCPTVVALDAKTG